jgi:capsid protein
VHGVELDALGRQVAYWVRREDGTSKRLPAWGERSGRRIAWLVYGTPLRLGEVRGESLLSVVLQSLREIDRYRDATLRKAVINSMLAMFIEKEAPVTSSRPITRSGAVRRDQVSAGDPNAPERTFGMTGLVPGLVIEELQEGETPKPFPTSGTDMGFGEFERAVIYAVAWANEIPPEILTLSFGSNYSASQAAINEFKTYLNKVRTAWGSSFCRPIYEEWLIAEVMNRRINASGLLDAWMDPALYDIYGAWVNSEWAGNIKPAVDLSKLVAGYEALVANGWMTRDRASRELTGTKYSKNAQQLRVENEQLAEANKALPQKSASAPPPTAEEIDEADEAENDDDNRDDEGKKAA